MSTPIIAAGNAVAVTPSDTADIAPYPRQLYIGVAGDVKVVPVGQQSNVGVLFKANPVGYMPVAVRRVLSTGTTATNIVALYTS